MFTVVKGQSGCSGAERGALGLIPGDAALQELLLHLGMLLSTQVTGFDFEYRWLEYLPYTHTSNTDCAGLPLDNSQISGSRDCLITLLCLYWINIINVSPFGWATCYLSGAVLRLCNAVHVPRML